MKTTQTSKSIDPRKVMDQIEKRFKRLSSPQKVQTLVDAGIVTKKKNVRAPYKKLLEHI